MLPILKLSAWKQKNGDKFKKRTLVRYFSRGVTDFDDVLFRNINFISVLHIRNGNKTEKEKNPL